MSHVARVAYDDVVDGLIRWADGKRGHEAAVNLLIDHGVWLRHKGFLQACCDHYWDSTTRTYFVSVNWDAVGRSRLAASARDTAVLSLAVDVARNRMIDRRRALAAVGDGDTALALAAITHLSGGAE